MHKKFYIIIIDSGWPTVAHEILQKSMRPLKQYLGDHSLTIFSEEESRDFLKEHHEEIGNDPIVIITDTNPKRLVSEKDAEFKGLRIDLGKVHDEDEAVKYLRQICQLIKNEKFIADVSWEERKKVAHAFIKDILGDVFLKFLELMV